MPNKKSNACRWILFLLCQASLCYARPDSDELGQVIQIHTRFHSFVGKPTWLLVIRDLDNNQTIPYLYDIKRGDNTFLALTYSRHYLITASRLQIETYRSRYNEYHQYRINNFCHLESNGRIIRGESLSITINGDLSPDSNTYSCHVLRFRDSNFHIANPAE